MYSEKQTFLFEARTLPIVGKRYSDLLLSKYHVFFHHKYHIAEK